MAQPSWDYCLKDKISKQYSIYLPYMTCRKNNKINHFLVKEKEAEVFEKALS